MIAEPETTNTAYIHLIGSNCFVFSFLAQRAADTILQGHTYMANIESEEKTRVQANIALVAMSDPPFYV
jgi:hypothetical protein